MDAYGRFAGIYDSLMTDFDYKHWAEYILSVANDAGLAPLSGIDAACGTGSLTEELAKRGISMTGADISGSMLFIAADKCRKAGLSINYVQQDMRRLALHEPVDLYTCVCDGYNYLTTLVDVKLALAAAFKALKPGGLAVFDISSQYKLAEVIGNNTFAEDIEDTAYIWSNTYNKRTHITDMELSFFVKAGTLYERFTEQHRQRAHSPEEIKECIVSSGLELLHVYGDWTKQKPKEKSLRIHFIAIKP